MTSNLFPLIRETIQAGKLVSDISTYCLAADGKRVALVASEPLAVPLADAGGVEFFPEQIFDKKLNVTPLLTSENCMDSVLPLVKKAKSRLYFQNQTRARAGTSVARHHGFAGLRRAPERTRTLRAKFLRLSNEEAGDSKGSADYGVVSACRVLDLWSLSYDPAGPQWNRLFLPLYLSSLLLRVIPLSVTRYMSASA